MSDGRTRSGKATAEAMTPEQRKERAKAGALKKAELASLLKAKYEGKLKIGDLELDVAVLENKQRIITSAAVFKALDRPARGNARLINIPTFMDAKNLQPYINQDLYNVINKVQYLNLNGKIQEGYDALIIPLVSDLYLKTRDADKLLKSQEDTAKKAEILVRSLAKVGIVALVDEATGYEKDKAKNELAKILEAFVAKELQPWLKTFPEDFYKHIFRIYNIPYPPEKVNFRPSFIGGLTNDVVYARLAPELLPELKKEASKLKRKARLHQLLTLDVGHPKLREHLASLITLLKLSNSPTDFKNKVNLIHPKFNQTIPFDFSE